MGIMNILKGPRCDWCGRRKSDVCRRGKIGATLCDSCAKGYRAAGGATHKRKK